MSNALKQHLEKIQSRKHVQQIEVDYDDLTEEELEEFKRFKNAVPIKNTLDSFLAIIESLPTPRLYLSYQSIGRSLEDYYPRIMDSKNAALMLEHINKTLVSNGDFNQGLVDLVKDDPYGVIIKLYVFAEVDGVFLMLPITDGEAVRLNLYLRDI